MRNRRPNILLLVTALGVAALLGRAWIGHRAPAPAGKALAIDAAFAPAARVVRFETAETSVDATAAADAPVSLRVEQLSASESAQFAALCDLHLLAADVDLDLTTKQWSVLAEIVVQAQAVRHTYEARIAAVAEIAPGRFRLEIPAYAAAGDELRRQFLDDLRRSLGQETAAEVWTQLGRKLEGRFAGFGVSAQTLEITGDPAHAPGDVQVERVARYWNSVDATERVTTRREIHFPLAEDPTGEEWNALLALVPVTS